MRFSLLQFFLAVVVVSVVLGLGVNNYRLSQQLHTEQRYAQWHEGYSRDLRKALADARTSEEEIRAENLAQVNVWIKTGELKLNPPKGTCGNYRGTFVNYKLLDEPMPERGMRHLSYNR